MDVERKKILEMLASGKISVEEAERLLSAVAENKNSQTGSDTTESQPGKPKYLRVRVEPASGNKDSERVNIRVPLNLIRAGLKWAALIPKHTQVKVNEALKEKGIAMDFNDLKPDDLEELIVNLNDLEVEVEGDEKVHIFCE